MKKIHLTSALVALTLTSVVTATSAFAAPGDKGGYNLFNPTPVAQMRDMSTDRPDKTESPYTVDAGHYQIEMDLGNYTYNRYKDNGENTTTRGFGVAPINLKAGLTNSTDIQFVIDNYGYERTRDHVAGTTDTKSGFGDVTVRLKHNIWGNDGGKTAFAVMPYIKLPTNSDELGNDDIEGGLILPLGIELSDSVGLGLMAQFDALKDDDGSGYHAGYIGSATIGYDVTDKIGHYVELFVEESAQDGDDTVVTFDTGVTYALTDNTQLDAGVNIGLTEAADDFNPFIGVSFRF